MKKCQYNTHTHTHTHTHTKPPRQKKLLIETEGMEKSYNNSQKTINIKAVSTFLSMVVLNVKRLNFTIKRENGWMETDFRRQGTYKFKVKGHKKDIPHKWK